MTNFADDVDVYNEINELVRPHQMATPYTVDHGRTKITRNHIVKVPSLLRQLEWIAPTGRGDDRSGGGYESRPAAALEAIGVLEAIDTGCARRLRQLGHERTWGETEQLLAALAGKIRGQQNSRCHRSKPIRNEAGLVTCCSWHAAATDVHYWWTLARVATGWDAPAWRPANTCPMCGQRSTLRIKEVDQRAFCANCHEVWTPETIGLLAQHITAENEAERRPTLPTACWCPYPQPVFDRWPALCPACGSRFCHRAGGSRTAA